MQRFVVIIIIIIIIIIVVFVLGCNWPYLAVVKHVNKWIELLQSFVIIIIIIIIIINLTKLKCRIFSFIVTTF
jgi:hypothetical protein